MIEREFYRKGQLNLDQLLTSVQKGTTSVSEAKSLLQSIEDLGFAQLDLHRERRTGFSEVVFGENKTVDQVVGIVRSLMTKSDRVLVTRADQEKGAAVLAAFPEAEYHSLARCITWKHPNAKKETYEGYVCVVCAGTSDLPIAEEAALTVEHLGSRCVKINDVGVAGIHRLVHHINEIKEANAIIVVAGMEGALPSVVGGMVAKPVVAVPTSVGYGASFQGVSALLSMLNSCAPGIAVVNIDNGFGAGYFAALLNKNLHQEKNDPHE